MAWEPPIYRLKPKGMIVITMLYLFTQMPLHVEKCGQLVVACGLLMVTCARRVFCLCLAHVSFQWRPSGDDVNR